MSEIKTISGDIVTYGGDNSITDVKSLTVDLEPIQDGTPWMGTETDTTPYLNRTMPSQGNDYNRESGVIIGGTVAWNQLIKNPELNNTNNIYGSNGTVTASNGMATITANGVSSAYFSFSIDKTIINHVYVVSTDVKLDGNNQSNAPTNVYIVTNWSSGGSKAIPSATKGTKKTYSTLLKPTVGDADKLHFYPFETPTPTPNGDMAYFSSPLLIDLTAMFGSTIANYIYSLEQSQAGAGVAWFKKYFPKDYYPYSANTLESVQATAHKTYDGDGNVIGNYALDSSLTLRGIPKLDASNNLYYDGDTYASDGSVTRNTILRAYQSGDESLANAITDGTNTVVYSANASTETAQPYTNPQVVDPDGTEEYVTSGIIPVGHESTYSLVCPISGHTEVDVVVSPTTDAEDGNTYTTALGRTVYGGTVDVVRGTLVDNMVIVDGGTLNWNYWYNDYFYADVTGKTSDTTTDIMCDIYPTTNEATRTNGIFNVTAHKSIAYICDTALSHDASGAAALKTKLSGHSIAYKLATPQTYQLTPQQIEALLGVNNLWSSAGEVTLSYTENVLMPESMSINGKYLEAIVDGYLTLGTSGRRSLGRELDTYSVGSADGETVKGDRFPSRKITVNYVIQSDSEEELINSVNQLNNILNQDEADFVFRDESDKFFTGLALLDAEPKKYRHAVKGTWTLYCAYPFKRSVEPITLVSTKDASISGNSATFVFDYNGTRPARPVLRARFASAKSGGDYNEDGDCGFVAFVDGDEHIIQLGNPDVIDVDAANKNASLVNSELDAFTGWTNSGMSIRSITDQFWENGKGQTQNYASGNGSIRRNIASTIGFEYDMVHRLCVSDPSQIGTFKVLLKNGNKTVVGFSIEKTGSGTGGTVKYIINDKTVGTDNIDLSYYNPHFGYCNRSPVYVAETYYTQAVTYVKKKKKKKKKKVVSWVANTRWVQNGWSYTQSNLNSGISRDGGVVTFSIGELADRTFKSSDIDTMACTSLSIESTGSFNTNAVRSVALIQKAGVPFAEIPNVFTSGDVVEGDCNSANVYLHRKGSTIGHLEPQYGALGNDWEDFELKPGRNAIRAVWSNWVNANYKPVIEITYNEVFL